MCSYLSVWECQPDFHSPFYDSLGEHAVKALLEGLPAIGEADDALPPGYDLDVLKGLCGSGAAWHDDCLGEAPGWDLSRYSRSGGHGGWEKNPNMSGY